MFGAAGGSRGHCGSIEGVEVTAGQRRLRSFNGGAAGDSRGHCRSKDRVQLQGGSSSREQRSLRVAIDAGGAASMREQQEGSEVTVGGGRAS